MNRIASGRHGLDKCPALPVLDVDQPQIRIKLEFPFNARPGLLLRAFPQHGEEQPIGGLGIVEDALRRRAVEVAAAIPAVDKDKNGAGFLGATPGHGDIRSCGLGAAA